MSQDIIKEVMFLLHSFLLGVVITFIYDGFLILRRLFRHTSFLVSLEDTVFWIACAIGVFCVLYKENNGTLRWFSVAGAALGMVIYKKTVSPLIIHIVVKILSFVLRIFGMIFKTIMKPFLFIGRKAVKKGRKIGEKVRMHQRLRRKALKKKLTEQKKTRRIMNKQ